MSPRAAASVLLLLGLGACAPSYRVFDYGSDDAALAQGRPVLISIPRDATFRDIRYSGSGGYMARAAARAFRRHAAAVEVTATCHGPECLARPEGDPFGYYVQPDILHWEDRATAWSRRRDRVEVRLTVYDLYTGLPLAAQVVEGRSPGGTLQTDRPEDLLDAPIAAYVDSLYR